VNAAGPDPVERESAGEIETRWLADSVRLTAREARSFARTVAAITIRPARFARGWVTGELSVMNPLGYFATSVAIVAVCQKLAFAAVGVGEGAGLLVEVVNVIGPYLYYVALGMLCHVMLRARGSRRTARASLAIALYAGGGPFALATIVNLVAFMIAQLRFGKLNFSGAELLTREVFALGVVAFGSRLAALIIFARALSGLHAQPARWTALALLLALAITALAFGLLDPPGNYGGHFIIGEERAGERIWWPSYGF
jgi:hypothetical protein